MEDEENVKGNDRIRFIFGERRSFSLRAAAAAFDRSVQWIESNRFSRENGDFVHWEEMVLLANNVWTNLQVHRALGADVAQVFPSLALLAPLTVRIPIYKIIAIRDEARRRHIDVSEVVGDPIDVCRDEAEWLELRHPGYFEAWRFPYQENAERR